MWSPPYYAMRDYGGHPDEIGQPGDVRSYVADLVVAVEESMRVLRPGRSLFVNVADRYVNRAKRAAPRMNRR